MTDKQQAFIADSQLWKPIPGYVGLYEVSSDGQVRSLSRKWCKGKTLSKRINPSNGYEQITLSVGGKPKTVYIHRLVASAFICEIPGGKDVNHIDSNRTNNLLSNLEIVTRRENMAHARGKNRVSQYTIGSDHPQSVGVVCKTIDGDVVKRYGSINQAARHRNVDSSGISACVRGKCNSYKGFIWERA